jgi:AcrR family transcriptional regulator
MGGMPRRYRMGARTRAVEGTRSRIVGAAMELHSEQGALVTNWEEIAQRAGVAPATVYRHFPSLDELIPACARTVFDAIGVITEEQVGQIYAGATTPWQRLERFIRGTCDCYARGDGWLHAARREADLIPAMNRAVEVQEKSNEVMVRAAFASYQVDEETIAVLKALTDFPFWRSLTRGGMTHAQAVEVICGLVEAELEKKQSRRALQ